MGTLPHWLFLDYIVGFEEDENEGENENSSEDSTNEADDGSPNDEGEKPKTDGVAGLKSALRAERKANRDSKARITALEAQLAAKDSSSEEGEQNTAALQKELEKTKAANEKLIASMRKSAVKTAAVNAAGQLNFVTPQDVLAFFDVEEIEVDQDADDPSIITFDEDEVIGQVKAIANKKKYLVRATENPGERLPSGGSYSGGKKNKSTDEALFNKYPI